MATNLEKLLLERSETSDNGTFGAIMRGAAKVCDTCELPWKDNQSKISCIPKGNYLVTRYQSPTKGSVFLINGVKNRDMIEMHVGNTIKDILGCVAVGTGRGIVHDLPAVISSRPTLEKMLAELPNSFYLQVTGVCG